MSIRLPDPLVPLPPLTTSAPPRPPEATPEASAISPAFPEFADPELNLTHPLDPANLMAPLRIVRVPLLADEPPEAATTPPPLCSLPLAAHAVTRLPAPLVPMPTCKPTLPPRPAVPEPEPMLTTPVFPDTADPELNTSRPLPPLAPPFVEVTLTIPLLARTPSLETMAVDPPLWALPRPDATVDIGPPPLVPLPTIT